MNRYVSCINIFEDLSTGSFIYFIESTEKVLKILC